MKLEDKLADMVRATMGKETLRIKYGGDADLVVQALVFNIIRFIEQERSNLFAE